MRGDLTSYVVECCRQAPHAWRTGAVVMAVLINVLLIIALAVGWQLQAYPTPWFLAGATAVAILDVLIILPYRLWKANRAEIARLRGDHLRAKDKLWELREKGVRLRNEGMATTEIKHWTTEFEAWHKAVLGEAAIFSSDLRHSLDPLDRINDESWHGTIEGNGPHTLNVAVMSEIMDRMYKFLNRETE